MGGFAGLTKERVMRLTVILVALALGAACSPSKAASYNFPLNGTVTIGGAVAPCPYCNINNGNGSFGVVPITVPELGSPYVAPAFLMIDANLSIQNLIGNSVQVTAFNAYSFTDAFYFETNCSPFCPGIDAGGQGDEISSHPRQRLDLGRSTSAAGPAATVSSATPQSPIIFPSTYPSGPTCCQSRRRFPCLQPACSYSA